MRFIHYPIKAMYGMFTNISNVAYLTNIHMTSKAKQEK